MLNLGSNRLTLKIKKEAKHIGVVLERTVGEDVNWIVEGLLGGGRRDHRGTLHRADKNPRLNGETWGRSFFNLIILSINFFVCFY